MKRTYKDLSNDQLADLHRAALGLTPVTVVRINRSAENLEEHPFVATRTDDTPDTISWWIENNTMSVTDSVLTADFIAAAGKAREFGIGLPDDELLDRNRLAEDIEKTGREMADWAQDVSDSFDKIRGAANNQP